MYNSYIGHPNQIRGAEEYILKNGRGDGMKFINLRNGKGLDLWISLDRGADISRLTFKGDNMGYFGPSGYVASKYYDPRESEFLKSFTGGFMITCGLANVGGPCEDEGEKLPLHGNISHIPAILKGIDENDEGVEVTTEIRDSSLFGRKLKMVRKYFLSYKENKLTVEDTVTNEGDTESPHMILYHCNMGYPLLDETSDVRIPHTLLESRGEHSEKNKASALNMQPPTEKFEECCYFLDIVAKENVAKVGIFNDNINKGVVLQYDKRELPLFNEWKMMGKHDYVLGLEPGNALPLGRAELRKRGLLKTLLPEQSGKTGVTFSFIDSRENFDKEW